mgnify:CR=1 FL=1
MALVDADAHVVENEHTFDFLDPADRGYRPVLFDIHQTRRAHDGFRKAWFIDGKLRTPFTQPEITEEELVEVGEKTGRPLNVPLAARRLENIPVRLAHMDALKIDIQILYPTLFIGQITDKPALEVGLCRSYHRWMDEVWQQGGGRLRWVAPMPMLSMEDTLAMLPWVKEHGAAAINMRCIEGHRLLHDPYFYPLYAAASDLDLPIAIHISNGNLEFFHQVRSRITWGAGYWSTAVPTVGSAHSFLEAGIPQRFPKLRVGLVEAAAQWIPWVTKDLHFRTGGRLPAKGLFEQSNMYVSCYSSTDDIEYIAEYSGEGCLMTGTDYGHTDMSAETDALQRLADSGTVRPGLVKKILEDNPMKFYALQDLKR